MEKNTILGIVIGILLTISAINLIGIIASANNYWNNMMGNKNMMNHDEMIRNHMKVNTTKHGMSHEEMHKMCEEMMKEHEEHSA
jgi:hypothetical protein